MINPDGQEKGLQKKVYFQRSIAAGVIVLNSIYAGVMTYYGESLDYPILFPLLHIFYFLRMLPSILLIAFRKDFRMELAALLLAMYIIILLAVFGTLQVI